MSDMETVQSTRQLIEQQLQWRYGTRSFDASHKINDVDWNILAETPRMSPSSFGLQPWRFVLVQSEAIRARLSEAAPLNKPKIDTASHIVVFARLKTVTVKYIDAYFDLMAEKRGVPLSALQDFRNLIVKKTQDMSPDIQANWTARQSYIALGSLLNTAALLGIDACGMEGIDPEPRGSLQIPPGVVSQIPPPREAGHDDC